MEKTLKMTLRSGIPRKSHDRESVSHDETIGIVKRKKKKKKYGTPPFYNPFDIFHTLFSVVEKYSQQ